MKSLHTRLDPIKTEVLDYTRRLGRSRAMAKFGVLSYVSFTTWLAEETGDENYGLVPEISLGGRENLGTQLVEAFLRKLADLEARLAERNAMVKYLEAQLEQRREVEENQALTVMEACRC